MKAAAVAFLLVLAVPSVVASAAEVRFQTPAQADGSLHATGSWVLLVFGGDGPGAAFDLDLAAGGVARDHVQWRVHAGGLPQPWVRQAPPTDSTLAGPVAGTLAARGWSSLYVEADTVALSVDGTGRLAQARAGEAAAASLPDRGLPEGTTRGPGPQVAVDGAALALDRGAAGAMPVRLEASGVRRVEWHNATLACRTADCPQAGASDPSQGGAEAGPGGVAAEAYLELLVDGGSLAGAGDAVVAAAGGPALGLEVSGHARLPGAHVAGTCGRSPCPDPAGGTLATDGELRLAGLRPAADGGLQGSIDGAFVARIDERAAFPFVPVAAAGLALGLALLAKALLALFARSARPPPLRHPRRRELYDLVGAEPGLSFRGLQRRLAWANGKLANHLARLEGAGLLVRRPHRNTVRYFQRGACDDGSWAARVALADPRLREMHAWLAGQPGPGLRVADIVRHAQGQWGWRRSTTQDRLRALLEAGAAGRRAAGGRVLYHAVGPG